VRAIWQQVANIMQMLNVPGKKKSTLVNAEDNFLALAVRRGANM